VATKRILQTRNNVANNNNNNNNIAYTSNSLKPTRVILGCDEHVEYIQFWETIATHWKQVHGIKPTLFFVGSETVPINKAVGDVIVIPPIPGVPTSFIAQVVRLLGPSMFPQDICVLCDIDLFLLDTAFFQRYLHNIPKTHFVSLNRYTPNIPKMSMCYQIAEGKLFAQLFGCNGTVEHMCRIIQGWKNLASDWSTDEKILTTTLKNWGNKNPGRWHMIRTPGLWGSAENTISRYHGSKYNEIKLRQKHYIEFEPPRPLSNNLQFIKHILTTANPGYLFPTQISYMGKNTGPLRHPWAQKKATTK
jgi:hypothetical protein